MNDYNSLLSDQEIAILREKKDWKTTMTIISMWAQVFLAFSYMILIDMNIKKSIGLLEKTCMKRMYKN